ncbi:MAG: Gfo/Idh/MocA family oxidoreductase [bacterium]|nr:Gfo/Idh/MocA family oxidoreductase [bacterium]
MKPVGVGIIGCGGRVRALLGNMPKLGERIRIVAVCDPDRARAESLLRDYKAEGRIHDDHRKLARDPAVDWVIIGSWNALHRAHAVAALAAGKDVYCEKPLATTLPDLRAIKRAWEKSPRLFHIGFVLRYSSHYRKIKELIDQGAIGQIISMEFNEVISFELGGYIHGDWRRLEKHSGPYLLEKCCHDIDLAHWMVGSLPRRVASFAGLDFFVPANRGQVERVGSTPNGRPAFSVSKRHVDRDPFTADKDIVDNQVAILEFRNNVRATFHTNCSSAMPERRMYICGTEGTLRGDVETGRIEVRRIGYNLAPDHYETKGVGGHYGGDHVLGASLVESMLHGAPPLASLEEGFRSAVTCLGIEKARKSGRVVDMEPLWRRMGVE